jgi:CTP:molybdopterin cytidylyltransferase MocA
MARHSRESGNPVGLNKRHYVLLDSRFRGNDGSRELMKTSIIRDK